VGGLDSEITTPAANLDVESGSRSGIDIENVTEGYESNLFYCDLEPATSSVTGDKQNNILVEEGRSKSGSIGRSRSWSSFLYGLNSQPSSTSLDRDFGINDGGSSLSLLKESDFGSIDSINTDITPSSRSAASTPTKSKQYADLVENSNLTGNRRCLVVEDEDANRHLCAKLTTAFGYDTMQASDGIECLQMVLGQANVSKVDLLRAQRSQNSTLGTLMHSKNMPSISMKSINDMMRMSSSDAKNSTSSGDDETKESKSERKEEVFDLVVIDNWMPNLSGMESVRRLRSANYNGTIIGLTAQTDESVLEAFKNAGCDKVFAKPLKVDEFQQYLRSKQLEMDTNNANTLNHEFKGSM
jgi:CheY-like chemotaxis protein